MGSGNWIVDAHEAEQRRLEKRHLCDCGSDDYTEEAWCREIGCDCRNDCFFKQEERGLVMRLLYRFGILKAKADPKCGFFAWRAYCGGCRSVLELEP